ncbi:hypothetical protein BDZ91DRAFT_736339 [Kalaharituber pfeilii]|nr:hypothetical protein BDZ91DRAFT_736339 [Kalaharituber pfeilii]
MSPEYDYLSHFSDAGRPFHQHDVHTGPNSTRRFFVIPLTGENSISLQPRHNSVRKIRFRPSPTALLTAHSTATSTFTHPLSSLPSYRLLQHPVQQQLRLSLLRDILQHLRRLSCGTSTIFLRPYSSPW